MQHPEIIPSTSAQSVDESMPSSEANYEQLNTPPLEDGYGSYKYLHLLFKPINYNIKY